MLDTTTIETWGLIIAIFVAISGIVIALKTNDNQKKQNKAVALFKIFELMSSKEMRSSRKTVHDYRHKHTNDNPISFEDKEIELDVDLVLSSLDQVSVIVLHKLIDVDLFIDVYGEMMVREWNALEPEIIRRQNKNKKTLKHFTEVKKWFEKLPQVKNTIPY